MQTFPTPIARALHWLALGTIAAVLLMCTLATHGTDAAWIFDGVASEWVR